MNPYFSVIVPIYNKEKYLKECVDSVLIQTFKDFELILVDDGSYDNSPLICDEYKKIDKRVNVIHKNNGGLVSARKEGVNIAIGKYSICLDADDYLKENYLLEIYNSLIQKEVDVICTAYTEVRNNKQNKKEVNYREGYYSKEDIVKELYPSIIRSAKCTYFPMHIWAKGYKTELYKYYQNKVDDFITIGEDGCVTIPFIINSNSLSIINSFGYMYRINTDSMTSKSKALKIEYPKEIGEFLRNNIDEKQYDFKSQLDRIVIHQLFSLVISLFNLKENAKEKILSVINDEYYLPIINRVNFSNIKANVLLYLIKHKQIKLLEIIYKLSNYE